MAGKLMKRWLLVAALVVVLAMQVAVAAEERRRERPPATPKEEERRAEEEEWRRREKVAEEERRRRHREEEEEAAEERERPPVPGEEVFLMPEAKRVVSTEAGEMRVVRGSYGGRIIVEKPLHIGFITMEPRTLFVPQYLDSSLIIFLRRGDARIGLIYEDELAERQLRMGDVYRIPAGSTFYIVNTGETQRLHIICSIDPSEGLGFGTFQSFFVGGGANPVSVLAGFDPQTLSTAFNVSIGELRDIMTRQEAGPIIYADTTHSPSLWANFLKLKAKERLERLKSVAPNDEGFDKGEKLEQSKWSWRKLLDSLMGNQDRRGKEKGDRKTGSGPDPYNLYDRNPDFRNNYGWSLALDKHDYSPLKRSGIGLYLVNLTAGSMMAPHVNPRATEYGIVLRGSGTIQVVYPNGSSAMNAKVKEGDVFWIPRYFPFCQIASRSGPFEFFGFTTSAHRNRPQFLVGASSILRTMVGPEFATAFGLTEDRFREIVDAQREAVILPSPAAAPPDSPTKEEEGEEKKRVEIEKVPKFIRSLGSEMIMGFE